MVKSQFSCFDLKEISNNPPGSPQDRRVEYAEDVLRKQGVITQMLLRIYDMAAAEFAGDNIFILARLSWIPRYLAA